MTEIDRDTGTIWFLYHRPLTTREELPGELNRLQDLGWIERTPKDRWLITSAGSEALSAARNWVFQADQISQDKEYGRHAAVIGRLLAGSMAFFADPDCNGFTIKRDNAPETIGWVRSVRSSDERGPFTGEVPRTASSTGSQIRRRARRSRYGAAGSPRRRLLRTSSRK